MLILAYSSNNKILTKCTYGYLWIQQGQKPSARAAHSAVRFGCKVFIFGGRHMNLRLNDLHCLDLSTMTWSGRLEKFTFYFYFFFTYFFHLKLSLHGDNIHYKFTVCAWAVNSQREDLGTLPVLFQPIKCLCMVASTTTAYH